MASRRSTFFAAALAVTLLVAVLPAPALAGGIGKSRLEAQLGVRLASTPPANAKIGSTFEGVVVDPAKLAGKGFQGIRANDKVLLKIVGPNNEFRMQGSGDPSPKYFKFNAQGMILPSVAPAAHAPNAAPAVKQ